jgi:hypothetical protein
MEFNYRSQRFLLVFGATCILTSIIWCNFANALERREHNPNAQLVDKSKPIVDVTKTENDNYPTTPEGVIEDFVRNNHSVKAMKRYYLNCEGIDCEGEVTQRERFMMIQFDFDLDLCKTEGLNKINSNVMSGYKLTKSKIIKNKAKLKVIYKMKGIINIACVPTPNIQFIPYKNWKATATFDLIKHQNKWKINEWFIDIQPPFPKSEDWAIEKIERGIQYNANNSIFVDKAKECINNIKKDKNCLIQKW